MIDILISMKEKMIHGKLKINQDITNCLSSKMIMMSSLGSNQIVMRLSKISKEGIKTNFL